MKISAFLPRLVLCLAAALLTVCATIARADTVNFGNLSTQTASSPYSIGGLTITGSGTLSFENARGFGILGGNFAGGQLIDGNEFAKFSFNLGIATGVSYNSVSANAVSADNSRYGVEGFGPGGASLGVVFVAYNAGFSGVNVSALFGNVPLSSFNIEGGSAGSGTNVYSLTFSPAAVNNAVPETGNTALLLAASLLPLSIAGVSTLR